MPAKRKSSTAAATADDAPVAASSAQPAPDDAPAPPPPSAAPPDDAPATKPKSSARKPAAAGKTVRAATAAAKPPERAAEADAKAARKAAKKAGREVTCRITLTRAQMDSLARLKESCRDAGFKLRKSDVMAWALQQLAALDDAQLAATLKPVQTH